MAIKRRAVSFVLVISLLAGSTGCSWVFMSSLDDDHKPSEKPSCSDWYVWPVIDGINGASLLISYFSSGTGGFGGDDFSFAAAAAMLLPAFLFLQSGIVGSMWARECNMAIDEHERWKEEQVQIRIERSNEPREGRGP